MRFFSSDNMPAFNYKSNETVRVACNDYSFLKKIDLNFHNHLEKNPQFLKFPVNIR